MLRLQRARLHSDDESRGEKLVRRLAYPVIVTLLMACLALFSNDTVGSSSVNFRELIRHRSLMTPYNTTPSVLLPSWTNNLVDVWETNPPSTATPLFWYIPKGGGSTLNKIMTYCLNFTLASDKGASLNQSAPIGGYELGSWVSKYPQPTHRFVNCRTDTENGLDDCASRGLLEAQVTDVFTTHMIEYATTNVFSTPYKGRAFAMFRHPVKRVIDEFFYRQHATFEGTFDAELASSSLYEFSLSDMMVENFEVKSLNGITDDTVITTEHVNVAKEILRQKMLVLIFEWYDVSVVRMEKYFGWWDDVGVWDNYTINNCHFDFVEYSDHIGDHPMVPSKEDTLENIMVRNWADVELYHYAKILFADQAKLAP